MRSAGIRLLYPEVNPLPDGVKTGVLLEAGFDQVAPNRPVLISSWAYDQAVESREETSKYTDLMPDGRARKWTWVMDAKSVITSPSPQAPVRHGKGPLVITGLAWSGHGKVARVDVSLDGGRNWQEARITGEAKPKALTRFHLDIDWDGSELLLQSRAVDETGYVQPTKDELRKVRGANSIYHNNGIQTWLVRANGETENVEIG